jgi:HSP20 family molecular chaperone IbpA
MSDQVTPRPANQPATERSGENREGRDTTQSFLRPPVDIFEDADGITLHLDMPGVARDRVKIDADRQTLSIEGAIQIPMAEGMEAIYAEVHSTQYRRSFTLSGELDTERVDASLNDGVLTVRIPRRAELRPRKIEVRAG